ncbi:hypothetical protein TrVE_jg8993 [Triparma verrucosa]|uniref:DUF7726 domain-containing protein n=1 Tax=Triparma verrucosa TaxID=1606542 RepID=A0A9W7BKR4_9STRA|nr:hypothetical protein TrVE_jg8993 [Triparma verrucosa]
MPPKKRNIIADPNTSAMAASLLQFAGKPSRSTRSRPPVNPLPQPVNPLPQQSPLSQNPIPPPSSYTSSIPNPVPDLPAIPPPAPLNASGQPIVLPPHPNGFPNNNPPPVEYQINTSNIRKETLTKASRSVSVSATEKQKKKDSKPSVQKKKKIAPKATRTPKTPQEPKEIAGKEALELADKLIDPTTELAKIAVRNAAAPNLPQTQPMFDALESYQKQRYQMTAALNESLVSKKSPIKVDPKNPTDLLLSKISQIELVDGRVFDSCDDVRRKSLEFMATHKCTRAAFLRALCPGNRVKPKSWKVFTGFVGEFAGAGNRSYFLAYYFLEKLRVLQGEPKSAARIESERMYPNGRPFSHARDTSNPHTARQPGVPHRSGAKHEQGMIFHTHPSLQPKVVIPPAAQAAMAPSARLSLQSGIPIPVPFPPNASIPLAPVPPMPVAPSAPMPVAPVIPMPQAPALPEPEPPSASTIASTETYI